MFRIKSIFALRNLLHTSLIAVLVFICIIVVNNFISNLYYLKWENSPKSNKKTKTVFEKKALSRLPDKADYYYELGLYYHQNVYADTTNEERDESFNLSKKYLKKAIMLQPSNARYMAEYAWVVGSFGDIQKAITYFDKAILLDKTNGFIHEAYSKWAMSYAKSVLRIDDPNFLLELYKQPNILLPFYYDQLINGFKVKTFLKIAKRELDEALRLGLRENEYIYRNMAYLALMQGKLNDAIDNLIKARDNFLLLNCYLIKRDYKAILVRARNFVHGEDKTFYQNWDEISTFLEKVTTVWRDKFEIYYLLGLGFYKHGITKKAIENLKKATTFKPKDINCHLYLARSYEYIGKSEMASLEYTKILRIQPGHKEANDSLSRLIKESL